MNTGFLGHAVATVLTVYGIETNKLLFFSSYMELQQYLPFTVLKPVISTAWIPSFFSVATVLTVYGIET